MGYEERNEIRLRIVYVTCMSCRRITPQYEQSVFEFNCIYEDCDRHISFEEITLIGLRRENERKKMSGQDEPEEES